LLDSTRKLEVVLGRLSGFVGAGAYVGGLQDVVEAEHLEAQDAGDRDEEGEDLRSVLEFGQVRGRRRCQGMRRS
jgi:hypothetical protein